jgi:hypothetical protein
MRLGFAALRVLSRYMLTLSREELEKETRAYIFLSFSSS